MVLFEGFELLDVFGPLEMSLALIEEFFGPATAVKVAPFAEYEWHRDADWDPLAKAVGSV